MKIRKWKRNESSSSTSTSMCKSVAQHTHNIQLETAFQWVTTTTIRISFNPIYSPIVVCIVSSSSSSIKFRRRKLAFYSLTLLSLLPPRFILFFFIYSFFRYLPFYEWKVKFVPHGTPNAQVILLFYSYRVHECILNTKSRNNNKEEKKKFVFKHRHSFIIIYHVFNDYGCTSSNQKKKISTVTICFLSHKIHWTIISNNFYFVIKFQLKC